MTTQATGDEQNPAAEQPRPAAEEPPPAAVLEPALNPLQRLIQQRLRERGWSYREVARRGGLPHSTVHTLASTRNLARPPRPATIDALAKGLDVPVSAVRAAAAESTGLHYYDQAPAGPENPGDPERELLIASIDELTPEERRHVAALVESLRNRTTQEPQDPLASPARGGPGQPPGPPRGRFYPIGSPAGTPSWSASSS
jgi:transcriptional regulator with XRE-family HTH domain